MSADPDTAALGAWAVQPAGLRPHAGGVFAVLPELADHDPAAPELTYRRLIGPPRHVAEDLVLVTRYDDCSQLLRDPRLGRSPRNSSAFEGQGSSFLAMIDPPGHTVLRAVLAPAFSKRAVEALRPSIEDAAGAVLDAMTGRAEVDLAVDLARRIPLLVLGDILGIPRADAAQVGAWSEVVSYGSDLFAPPRDRVDQRDYRRTLRELRTDLRALITDRRAHPREDLTSALVTAVADGSITELQAIANLLGMLVAGHETTASTLGEALVQACADPTWFSFLAGASDEDLDAYVSESMRLASPSQVVPRVAVEDLDLGTVRVRRGTSLLIVLAAANRDPAAFPDPDRVVLRREPPAGHLAFGGGLHYCLGATLARVEARITLREASRRLLEVRPTAPAAYTKGWAIRVPSSIPVRLGGIAPAGTARP